MMQLSSFISSPPELLGDLTQKLQPWEIVSQLEVILLEIIKKLPQDQYKIENNIAIHKTATIEGMSILKGPIIVGPNAFIASYTYLRGGVLLDEKSIVGPYSELKTSILGKGSSVSHLNYIGNSFIGSNVNIEAGAMFANYFNEKQDKEILLNIDGQEICTGIEKFGALVGDDTKIGANAVLSPGTVLSKGSIVERLALL